MTLNLGQHHPGTGTIRILSAAAAGFFFVLQNPSSYNPIDFDRNMHARDIDVERERELRLTKNSQGVRKGFLFPLEVETRQAHCALRFSNLF